MLLVLYPSASVLGSSTGGAVFGSSYNGFGSSPDGSVYHIDEAVKQKGNGVEILKPGGGGMVEGLLGEGGRGLAARHVDPILDKNVNISNDHVSVKYWVSDSHEDRLPLSAELEKLILNYSEKLIMVLKDWSGPRITQYLGEGWVVKTELEWSCNNNLSTCLPPVHKNCFAQLDTVTLGFNKQLQEHSVDHYLGMQITLIDDGFLAGESPEMSLADLYSSLMNSKYSEVYKSKDKKYFQKYVDSKLPEDIEWFLKQQPLWEFSSKDLDAMKRRLEYQMNGTFFFNGAPTFSRAIRSSDQLVQPRQSKNKDHLKDHRGQIDRMIESDGLKLDKLVRQYPDNLPWGPARGEAKEEVEETINGTRTQQFMAPLRKQCPFWTDCSIEEMEKIAAQHQARVNRFTPLMQHGSPSKSWSDFDKDIKDLVKYYQSIAPLWQMGVPGLGKKEWDEQMETLLRQTTEAIGKFRLRLPDCTEKDVENAVQKAETKLRSIKSLIQSRDVDQLATRDISKNEWAEFDKQTEGFGKTMDDLARKLATLDPSNLPQLGRETFDEQAGDLISANAEHFREKCLGTSGCTEHDVLTMVHSMKERIQKSSDLMLSPASLPTVRDLSSEEWASVDGRIEAFGKSADNLAQKLATTGDPGARKALDQTTEEWIRVIAQGTQEQCVAVEGCNEQDLAAITQKMRDRVHKSAGIIHSRDASTDAFDRSLVEFETQMDNLARQLNQIGLPGSKNLFDTVADEMFRVGEKIAQNQCISMGGCDDQVLATRLQKMKDRKQQSANLLHSREVSISLLSRDLPKEKWALINQVIENWGQNMDTITQNPAQIGLPELTRKDFEAFIDEQLPSQLKDLEDLCPITEGCNGQVLATIHKKYKDRAQKSSSLLHSRELPASAKRDFPVDKMAANDIFLDEFQKAFGGKVKTESWINVINWFSPKLNRFEKDIGEECRKTSGCTNQDAEKEIDRLTDKLENALKSTRDVHEEDNLEDNFFKEFTVEPLEFDGFNLETTTKIFRAAIQKICELHAQKVDPKRIREFLEKVQMFETQVTADAIIQHCKKLGNCGMGDLQSFVGLWEEESSKFLYSTILYLLPDNDKRSNGPVEELGTEKSRLARGNYPVEFSAGMDQTMEMANRIFYTVLPIIREFRLDKEYAERALKYVVELATKDSLRSCMELSYCTQQDVTLFSEKFEKKVHEFLGLMDWQPAGKRSDGLLIPFLDLKGPPSLTEGSIPADKRDSLKKISEIMDDDIAATRKILDAVFPVVQEFGAEQTTIVLLWVEKMMIDRMIELCKEEKECRLQGGDLKAFREWYHKLLDDFQSSVQPGEGPYADGLNQLETRDSAKNVSEIMNSKSFVTHKSGKNHSILLGIESLMLTEREKNTERCKKLGKDNCGMEFTVVIQAENDVTLPVSDEFTSDNTTAILLWAEKELQDQGDRLCKNSKVYPCIEVWEIKVGFNPFLYIVLPPDGHELAAGVALETEKMMIGWAADHCGPIKDCVIDWTLEISTRVFNQSEVAYRRGRFEIKTMVLEVKKGMSEQLSKLCEHVVGDCVEESSVGISGLVIQDTGAQSSKREDNLLEKSSQSSPTINHRADDTSTGMKDFQGFAEMDQGVDQSANQTAVEVDCNVDPTNKDCSPTPDPTPSPNPLTSETQGKDRLTAFINWLPFIALFSIISLLLLLLVLKCCTVWSRTRRSVPEESDGPPTPTKATSQPLLGPATRPDDEEAQMTQIREPVAPTGLDGASEGWARKWIPSKRGDEVSNNHDSCLSWFDANEL